MSFHKLCCEGWGQRPAQYLECAWNTIYNRYQLQISNCASGLCLPYSTMQYLERGEASVDDDSLGVCQDYEEEDEE